MRKVINGNAISRTGDFGREAFSLSVHLLTWHYLLQVHYDVGLFQFVTERYSEALHHFTQATTLFPQCAHSNGTKVLRGTTFLAELHYEHLVISIIRNSIKNMKPFFGALFSLLICRVLYKTIYYELLKWYYDFKVPSLMYSYDMYRVQLFCATL